MGSGRRRWEQNCSTLRRRSIVRAAPATGRPRKRPSSLNWRSTRVWPTSWPTSSLSSSLCRIFWYAGNELKFRRGLKWIPFSGGDGGRWRKQLRWRRSTRIAHGASVGLEAWSRSLARGTPGKEYDNQDVKESTAGRQWTDIRKQEQGIDGDQQSCSFVQCSHSNGQGNLLLRYFCRVSCHFVFTALAR